MPKDRQYVMLILMTFCRYMGDCFFYAYLFLFLKSRGLLENQIGLITCVTPLVAIIVNPLWNHLAKNVNINRLLMVILSTLEGICIFFFTRCNILETFVIVTVLIAIIGSPFYAFHDGFCEAFAKIHDKNYALIRSAGTFGYVVATLIAALLLHLTSDNYDLLFYLSTTLCILTSFWFIFIKPIDLKLVSKEENPNREYKYVLKNGSFWLFLLIDLLVIGFSYGADQYTSLYFTEFKNLSVSYWSLISASILITEFVVMLFTMKMKHMNENVAIIAVGFCYLIRCLVFALNLPLPFLIASSLLRGVAYGLYLPYVIKALEKICGLKNLTCAVFILTIAKCFIRALAIFSFGNLITSLGYLNFYFVSGVIVLIGIIINLIYNIKHKFKYPEYIENNNEFTA